MNPLQISERKESPAVHKTSHPNLGRSPKPASGGGCCKQTLALKKAGTERQNPDGQYSPLPCGILAAIIFPPIPSHSWNLRSCGLATLGCMAALSPRFMKAQSEGADVGTGRSEPGFDSPGDPEFHRPSITRSGIELRGSNCWRDDGIVLKQVAISRVRGAYVRLAVASTGRSRGRPPGKTGARSLTVEPCVNQTLISDFDTISQMKPAKRRRTSSSDTRPVLSHERHT